MYAFYLIDKPLGITSFDVIRQLRKKLGTSRIGHTGTLDPLATGLLLVAVGEYTKLIPYIEKGSKVYEFTVMLDGESASYDLGTEVQPISSADRSYFKENISRGDILRYLRKEFTGEIEQMPPKYSALKVDGKRALDRVRQGEEFDLKARTIQIDAIELLDYEYPRADLRAVVGPGTYIRSIAHDLGALIGSGGYVTFLRRTALANVSVDMAQQLDDFVAEKTLEISKLFSPEKYVSLSPEDQWRADNGLPIATIEEYIEGEYYFVIQELGITNVLQYVEGSLKPVRKLNIG